LALADGSEVALRLTVGVSFHPGTDTPLEGHPAPIDVPLAPTADNRGGLVRAALSRAPW
jgi:hypothetical protein